MSDSPPIIPPPPKRNLSPRRPNFPAVIRDILLIYALAFVGTCVIGLVSFRFPPDQQGFLSVILVLINLLGFIFSASAAAGRGRWHHLVFVSLGVWLSGFYQMLMGSLAAEDLMSYVGMGIAGKWIMSAVIVAILALAGGAISYAIKRDPKPEA
jgi:hypothetical protein